MSNIEREDEYMAAAEAFHDFIANLKSEKDLEEKLISLLSKRSCRMKHCGSPFSFVSLYFSRFQTYQASAFRLGIST